MIPKQASPDIYFSAAYGKAAAHAEKTSSWHLISYDDDQWQLPLLVRELSSGYRDAISPYGYCGIYCSPEVSDPHTLWRQTRDHLDRLGVVSIFIRDSPLVPTFRPPEALAIVDDHPTFYLRRMNEEAAWRSMEGRARTAVRKAIKSGVSATLRKVSEPDLEPGSPFRTLYESTMQRVGANQEYIFGDAYYRTLFSGLKEDLYIAVAEREREVLAASLFMVGQAGMHYHLSGSTREASRLGASNLLLWEAWRFASSLRLPGLHLGGGVRKGDSLEKFKRSFGGDQTIYSAYGVVIDRGQYETETSRAAAALGCSDSDLLSTGFFPAYRAQPSTD
ncbi:peptidoglycan bridge formation glycyltransferase FemA/FemB family protein [Dietzia cinnamea]|uniref:peptidoglycan bridge formation glycyltransferase FemA/FemB family protein n=1 Tax=Dietzia cinnamea TaxID=321318 RepID=UPI0021A36211|nr:peptidoglycan bridge formation glycyltransferase FemA/FemB family protein [Dietzia cinnamea]MCT2141230.1 peptidoglycan bridge formation glycyltransferase FemA/FemB family protein [Dietzia cinnamea]